MNAWVVAVIAFAAMTVSAGLAMRAARRLPADYVGERTQDTMKPTVKMIATVASLILGLMVTSARYSFSEAGEDVQRFAAAVLSTDLELAGLGQAGCEARAVLGEYARAVLAETWTPDPDRVAVGATERPSAILLFRLDSLVRGLDPADAGQTTVGRSANALVLEMLDRHWKVAGDATSNVPMAFLGVVVAWLALIYAGFGVFAPANPIAMAALGLSALCIAAALFLVAELGQPFAGPMRVSPEPMQDVLRYIERGACPS